MIIRIKNLRLRSIVGINEWERKTHQDVTINVEIEFDGERVVRTDKLEDTVDYKNLKRRIMKEVEESEYYLIDRLAYQILAIVMQDEKVLRASVEVDKPHALRFADSVSVSCAAGRPGAKSQIFEWNGFQSKEWKKG